MSMDAHGEPDMLPTDDLMPFRGALVKLDRPARGWARSLAIASSRLDDLLAHDFQAVNIGTDEASMWSRSVCVDGHASYVQADYVCRSTSSSSRMLRIRTSGAETMLVLDLHEAEIPQGWCLPQNGMSRHHVILVIRQFASLLRSVAAHASDAVSADVSARLNRADTIGRAMSPRSRDFSVRLPWTLGEGLVSSSMVSNPSEPIPEQWAGARITEIHAERDSSGLLAVLRPLKRRVPGSVSAVEAMRAVGALPPLALACAA